MQNILAILYRFRAFLLFILLEIICFVLIVRFNPHQRGIFSATSNVVSGWTFGIRDWGTRYLDYPELAQQLAEDNAKLFERLEASKFNNIIDTDTIDNGAPYFQQYRYLAAKATNNTTNNPNNYITINRGAFHKIQPHSGIISDHGIVGIVRNTSEHYSRGMSVLHRESRISAALGTAGFIGTLTWDGLDSRYLQLEGIPSHVPVEVGHKVETSGYSSIFPAGIHIGKVHSLSTNIGTGYHQINVELSNNLNNIKHVYVITNLLRKEQIELESLLDDE